MYLHFHDSIYIYMSICLYIYTCICICIYIYISFYIYIYLTGHSSKSFCLILKEGLGQWPEPSLGFCFNTFFGFWSPIILPIKPKE